MNSLEEEEYLKVEVVVEIFFSLVFNSNGVFEGKRENLWEVIFDRNYGRFLYWYKIEVYFEIFYNIWIIRKV